MVTIQYIIKSNDKQLKFMTKKCLNILEFCNKPISLFIVGMFLVNTDELSNDLYCYHEIDFKYKCFFMRVSNCNVILSSLCHEIL